MNSKMPHCPAPPAGFVERSTTPTYVIFERQPQRHSRFREELWLIFDKRQWFGQVPNWDEWSGSDADFYHASSYGTVNTTLAWFESMFARFVDYQAREWVQNVVADVIRNAAP